GVIGIAQ
nr:Chain A, GVTGIAQ segment from Superoxide dismutase [Cu-Zn] [Homo sapiens]